MTQKFEQDILLSLAQLRLTSGSLKAVISPGWVRTALPLSTMPPPPTDPGNPVLIPVGCPFFTDTDETFDSDYPDADIVLRSNDSHDFRVPKLYIVNSSKVLRKLIGSTSNVPETGVATDDEENPLPIVKLPENGSIVNSLLTFIFPVPPVLPSTSEKIMGLLAVAQKYEMESVLAHIRGAISRQHPPFIRPQTAHYVYFLAQKHGLQHERLQAARETLRLPMTIEDLENKVHSIPGTYLLDLWEYHGKVRTLLVSSLLEYRTLDSFNAIHGLQCGTPRYTPNPIPRWLDDYIESLAQDPHLFDIIEFKDALACHIKERAENSITCPCMGISSQDMQAYWEGDLSPVVHEAIEKVRRTKETS